MLKRTILIALALVLIPAAGWAEWKMTRHGFCVSDEGAVARCSMDEKTGKLSIGQAIHTKDGRCPT